MILAPTFQIGHHHKVTNITMSPTSLSPIDGDVSKFKVMFPIRFMFPTWQWCFQVDFASNLSFKVNYYLKNYQMFNRKSDDFKITWPKYNSKSSFFLSEHMICQSIGLFLFVYSKPDVLAWPLTAINRKILILQIEH